MKEIVNGKNMVIRQAGAAQSRKACCHQMAIVQERSASNVDFWYLSPRMEHLVGLHGISGIYHHKDVDCHPPNWRASTHCWRIVASIRTLSTTKPNAMKLWFFIITMWQLTDWAAVRTTACKVDQLGPPCSVHTALWFQVQELWGNYLKSMIGFEIHNPEQFSHPQSLLCTIGIRQTPQNPNEH